MKRRVSQALLIRAVAVLGTVITPTAAFAQSGGIRAGVSANPDQFFFGGHLDIGPLAGNVSFRPNIEAGLGNNLTTVAVNFEFAYWFHNRRKPWRVYAGGGPALVVYRYDTGGPRNGHSDTQPGFNLLIGVEHARGLFTEVKLGLIDSPEVKFALGYTFK